MFQKVAAPQFVSGEHEILHYWQSQQTFKKLREKNAGKPPWSFLDGPITANNPMGVHHAWGRTYKDAFQRFFAMTGHDLRYQNGFDCQGLWVEVEVEKELGLGTKTAINEYGIDLFTNACKKRVLKFAARQTEQSIRLGYWMEWDDPDQLRHLAEGVGTDKPTKYINARGEEQTGPAHQIVAKLGNPDWGGSYFTFSTENNETIWTFLKKCFDRKKIYQGHDVMPWSGRGGSAYSQMEIADGRKLTTHKSVFVKFTLKDRDNEHLLIWTTTPWTLTSNVAAMVNTEMDYIQVKANRDGASYYFAKENLNFQRLAKEYAEGFGRPEWQWPEGLGKLKTIAQMFKEQGGFEIVRELKGAEMVGWAYEGPFDELPAQQQKGGYPEMEAHDSVPSGVEAHRVVDGGRDFKGSPHVVGGEGTGIVHMAPGCGDIDHQIGTQLGLPVIAPLKEDGTYGEGFGEFSGNEAIAPETAELVFESLKAKGKLFAVETYPHIYPHCWRTGDELVFRLVDEWFINMDWRDEIKEVTKAINWLPDSIDGQNREVEWLTNMRDWMISKKRFWGLALPIWVDPETKDFEVVGSLAELKEKAVEGWDEFEGHTPHRPWIDKVKLRNPKTGNLMHRVEDVGNPWLDAGIVPFSTMGFNTHREMWEKWYPADLVTECFPGQFRNWFYSMLSLATMMRYNETDDPMEKRPFKNLLGHRLVMDETGQPMHKSDGTAIWFEEAAEQLGVDTLRWMYLAQNPATDLRFGTRHKDQHVTLETPEGPISETKEGLPTCLVTSKPADEIRRQYLIPLWNSYAFFTNYALLDQFDPNAEKVPYADRPEIDRWMLSRLQSLIEVAHQSLSHFDSPTFMNAAGELIDDLSNWYIRRNRRRFWRSQNAGDTDKLAAYQTLHEVLITLCQLLAPAIPFMTERMYLNLTGQSDGSTSNTYSSSVHLCDYPTVNIDLLDPELNARTALAQQVVALGHKVREAANLRVRQPLGELKVCCPKAEQKSAITELASVIADELNVKAVDVADSLEGMVSYSYKPNLKTLGPKYGKLLGLLRTELPNLGDAVLSPLRQGQNLSLELGGQTLELEPADVLISTEQATDWATADEDGVQVALLTTLTDDLVLEGMARDFVRQVQNLRKEADLEIENRITITYEASDALVSKAVKAWETYIKDETLADTLTEGDADEASAVAIGEASVKIAIAKV